jgi:hypothetical protein
MRPFFWMCAVSLASDRSSALPRSSSETGQHLVLPAMVLDRALMLRGSFV